MIKRKREKRREKKRGFCEKKKREIKNEKKKYCKRGMNLRLTEGEEKISLNEKGEV